MKSGMLTQEAISKLDELVQRLINGLHPSSTVLSIGIATVAGREHDAVLLRNLYKQEIVWGRFNVERGKYKGKKLANNANTDEVSYKANFLVDSVEERP